MRAQMSGKHSENAGQQMDAERTQSNLQELSVALCDLRDSLVLMSMALKDHFADIPSPARDEVMMQVERQIARIREGGRASFE
jgi:hypothetical protein